jgi:hypothetical protein
VRLASWREYATNIVDLLPAITPFMGEKRVYLCLNLLINFGNDP